MQIDVPGPRSSGLNQPETRRHSRLGARIHHIFIMTGLVFIPKENREDVRVSAFLPETVDQP